jgi:nitrous oxidase accessory protein
MRKGFLVIGLILLFVFMSINPSIAVDNAKKSSLLVSDGNILYVGGSGEGNYSRIQDAINNANAGDTVFVFDDSSPYYENVVINKSINLIGEDKNTTVIDAGGNGTVIKLDASYVTISGFTIQKCGEEEIGEGGGIRITGSRDNIITGNIITNNICYGIYCCSIEFFSRNIISGNIVTNNRDGICLDVSYNNEVYDNYIENNSESGIYVGSTTFYSGNTKKSSDEYYNNIYRNIIIKNKKGIYMPWAQYTNVFKNEITNNYFGIFLDAPYFTNCIYNNIYQNNIHNNNCGIVASTYCGAVGGNNISKNNIVNNSKGLCITASKENFISARITHNTISSNNFIGNKITVIFKYASFLDRNHWESNYWGKPRNLPYPIFGLIFFFPWVNFDWHPVKEPYDI